MLTEGQRAAIKGDQSGRVAANTARAQEIKSRRKQWMGSKTAPMIGPRGRLNAPGITSASPH